MIADYELLKENKADTALLGPAIERLQAQSELSAGVKAAYGDRGIHSAANEKLLEEAGIESGLCPKDPHKLKERLEAEPDLRAGLKRRGGTEARIAILRNVFCQEQLREKSHARRELAMGRAVLAHNLYVLAKLQRAQEQAATAAAAKARQRKKAAEKRARAAAA